ncbi:MAG: SCO family protein [Gammaproteobacteria bacterium]|nr:SCO family protein [Gammaproteobacteria bacterium]
MKLRPLLPLLLLTSLAGALGGGLLAHMLTQRDAALQAGTALPRPQLLALFSLTDTAGRAIDNRALLGHPTLLYFGFTACPDVCPATLATLRGLRAAGAPGELQMWFVTVDPQRDTPAVLEQYLTAFGPGFTGLRAAPGTLAPLLHVLGAYAETRALPAGQPTMDHSSTLYLLDRHGRLAAVFTPPYTAAVLAADLRTLARAARL